MSTLDTDGRWQEGRIPFMSDYEYEQLCIGRKRDQVALLVLSAADAADAAIKKMMRDL